MAIRLRTVQTADGKVRVALCAVETDPLPGDLYLDDGDHYALAAKFRRDWRGETVDTVYEVEWAAMDTQKLRDAAEEMERWTMPSVEGEVGR
jgi:hypothetical protein